MGELRRRAQPPPTQTRVFWSVGVATPLKLDQVFSMISDSVIEPVYPNAAGSMRNDYRRSVDPRVPGKGSKTAREKHRFVGHLPAVLVATKSSGRRVFADG